MVNANEIQNKLREFNLKGYADSSVKYQDNNKNGKVLHLEENDWVYEDEFYGGEPYSGNETLWYKKEDVFRCVYWGKVSAGYNFTDIYDFLRLALLEGPSGNCMI